MNANDVMVSAAEMDPPWIALLGELSPRLALRAWVEAAWMAASHETRRSSSLRRWAATGGAR